MSLFLWPASSGCLEAGAAAVVLRLFVAFFSRVISIGTGV